MRTSTERPSSKEQQVANPNPVPSLMAHMERSEVPAEKAANFRAAQEGRTLSSRQPAERLLWPRTAKALKVQMPGRAHRDRTAQGWRRGHHGQFQSKVFPGHQGRFVHVYYSTQ